MANDNIFQQYLVPPKSVAEYSAEMDQADTRRQALQQNALELAASRQKFELGQQANERAAQLRSALLALPEGATDDQRLQAMRGTGSPEGFAAADALSKSLIEQRKGAAAAAKDQADAAKTNLARDVALHDFHAQRLATVQTPEDALAWAQDGNALGLFKQPGQYERGLAMIQQASSSPEAFAKWKAAAMQGGQSITDQLKQQLEQAKQLEQVRQYNATETRIKSEGAADRAARAAQTAATQAGENLRAGVQAGGGVSPDMEVTARAIASGQLPAPTGMALLNPRNQRVVARVMEINPDYDASTVAAKRAAATAFTTGQQGNALRSVSTANAHLEQLGELVDAMGNGDVQVMNKVKNYFATQSGATAANSFDAIKNVVGQEVVKAIVAGGGSAGERDEAAKAFSSASSPRQLKDVIKHYQMVMGAQSDNLLEQRRAAGLPDSTMPNYNRKPAQRGAGEAASATGAAAKPSLTDIFGH